MIQSVYNCPVALLDIESGVSCVRTDLLMLKGLQTYPLSVL
ncbi:Uncharacterised protein [Pseudomonas putida]|nr:Uncharacterised protein [Pseudomonas putida]CAB5576064.1 Uncharacterised protein [Pseudomonas putida]CAB5594998.1 Uncharacterised protein [Pseudomonas putida]CAB5599955.1 Uncharacterised protein [Pseudomonas putida]CAB5655163.1 Uncharacterised protein [Pseudomonas putida]